MATVIQSYDLAVIIAPLTNNYNDGTLYQMAQTRFVESGDVASLLHLCPV